MIMMKRNFQWYNFYRYRQVSNIRRTFVGNKIVDHSDVVGASPVGAAPTTSSFSTKHLALLDWAKTTARLGKEQLSLVIWCVLYKRFYGSCNANWINALSFKYLDAAQLGFCLKYSTAVINTAHSKYFLFLWCCYRFTLHFILHSSLWYLILYYFLSERISVIRTVCKHSIFLYFYFEKKNEQFNG